MLSLKKLLDNLNKYFGMRDFLNHYNIKKDSKNSSDYVKEI